MSIKISVTVERFEEIVSIDDSMHFLELGIKEAYDYIVQFVVNEDGEYITPDEARKEFKKIPRKELNKYIADFIKAVGNAFVNPTSGADSAGP